MAQTSTKKQENMTIAVIVIAVLVISSVAVIIFYYQPSVEKQTSTSLDLRVSFNQTNVIQGNNLQAEVDVTSKGNLENVTLSGDTGDSGLGCSFEPATGASNFMSVLTVHVPDSTPTGNYSLTVTASRGEAVENASCIVSVLSANVEVSGRLEVYLVYPDGYLDSVQFQDAQTKAIYTVTFPFISIDNSASDYSITLQNEHTYNVTVSFNQGIGDIEFGGTYYAGSLYVYAPAGNSTISGQNINAYVYAPPGNSTIS